MQFKMTEHTFGGNWTEVKLARLAKYLAAYRRIFTRNERARHFTTWYVDAFAGTGSRSTGDSRDQVLFFEDVYKDADTEGYRDGSARIALGLQDPFDKYLFIDKSRSRVGELKATIERDHGALFPRCDFKHGDANAVLKTWCNERDWTKERAVVFLDPYGMQVEWSTVETLAATKAIDLWYLFPLGVGAARLLKHDGKIDESWQKRLDLCSVPATGDLAFTRFKRLGTYSEIGKASSARRRWRQFRRSSTNGSPVASRKLQRGWC